MKRLIGIISALYLIAGFGSCKKDIICATPVISRVLFVTTLSTNAIPDTSVYLVKYRKGSAFQQVSDVYPHIQLTKADFNKRMPFPDKGADVYDYDWEITMMPSGRIYRLSDINHESSTSTTSECTNTVTYSVNSVPVTVPGNPYSSVPNFISDIQITYN